MKLKFLVISFFCLLFFQPIFCLAAFNCPTGQVCLDNPLAPKDATTRSVDLYTLLGTIINAILGFVGALAFAMFIYGGLQLMTARGNDKQVTAGKDTLKWAAVGLAVIFSSYAAVKIIMDVLGAK
jgi:hypothetical protein